MNVHRRRDSRKTRAGQSPCAPSGRRSAEPSARQCARGQGGPSLQPHPAPGPSLKIGMASRIASRAELQGRYPGDPGRRRTAWIRRLSSAAGAGRRSPRSVMRGPTGQGRQPGRQRAPSGRCSGADRNPSGADQDAMAYDRSAASRVCRIKVSISRLKAACQLCSTVRSKAESVAAGQIR